MNPNDFKDLKEFASIVTPFFSPLILLFVGLKINRTLEKNKVQITKDKEWRGEWAKRFYVQAIFYNEAIEDMIMLLHSDQRETTEKLAGWEKRIEELQMKVYEIVPRIRKAEWSLITMCEFCPNSKSEVLLTAKQAFNQLADLMANKQGNVEVIRTSLHLFNVAAMKAHREILG
ncbi:hypothetical protein [Undibacterium sp. RuTC16W]|uniref:hypothetical protein n=1 Tax=Undibacterium sp. RuTC16W TaxID=3413048 RepID=UPI003BF3B9ED